MLDQGRVRRRGTLSANAAPVKDEKGLLSYWRWVELNSHRCQSRAQVSVSTS